MHNTPLDKIKELRGCREANEIEQTLIEHIGEEYWHRIYRDSKQDWDMIQDTLKTEIKNDIKNTLSKHGLMRGDKYAAEILQELATEFSKNIIVSSLYPPY